MGAATLNLDERFRSWSEAGLEFVFKSPDYVEPPLAPRVQPPAPQGQPARAPRPQRPAAPAAQPVTVLTQVPEQPLQTEFPWDAFRPRLTVPAKSVWTYWDLGRDFAQPSAPRRELFGRIMKALGWPAGSITFWPLSALHKGTLLPHPGHFWRGVTESQAQTVFCFGQRAFRTLLPTQQFSFTLHTRDNLTILPLPGPTAMLDSGPEAADAKRTAWTLIQNNRPF